MNAVTNKKVMDKSLFDEALEYHSEGKAGKIEVQPSKEINNPKDLSLAYSPGAEAPAREIDKERWKAYRYTNKGNLVAVISNGSNVPGLGNIGASASKPIMESKAMLFKLYADIDAFDLELSDEEPSRFIATVQALSPTFGGINLEDLRAPECFFIEEKLHSLIDIPILHDEQHGTAVTIIAALINACKISGKNLTNIKCVIYEAGVAGIATVQMLPLIGVRKENISMFATGDITGMLSEAIKDADVFIGSSLEDIPSNYHIKSMADKPIIFTLANSVTKTDYHNIKKAQPDAIIATGSPNFPNLINNVLAFPYLFRGALDTLSTTINEEMKIAAAKAIAAIAREKTPKEIEMQYNCNLTFGSDYLLPKPGDSRLLTSVSPAVAKAAIESGVARRNIVSFKEYIKTLSSRIDNENFFAKEFLRHKKMRRERTNNSSREHRL